MNLSQLNSLLPTVWDSKESMLMLGNPGLGKTEWMHNTVPALIKKHLALPEDHPFFVVDVRLAQLQAPDLGGYAMPARDQDNNLVVEVTTPTILNKVLALIEQNPECHGIVFIDECLQGAVDVQRALSPYLDGTMARRYLTENWRIYAATNPAKNKAGTVRSLTHNNNRFLLLNIEQDFDSWADWALAQPDIPDEVVAYAARSPDAVAGEIPEEVLTSTDPTPFCTARSLTRAGQLLHRHSQITGLSLPQICSNPTSSQTALLMELVAGKIGRAHTTQMFGFIKLGTSLPSYAEIINSPEAAYRSLPGDDRADIMHLVSYMVSRNLINNANHYLKESQVVPQSLIDECTQVMAFADLLPEQFALTTMTRIMTGSNASQALLGQVPAFPQWVQNKNESFRAIAQYLIK